MRLNLVSVAVLLLSAGLGFGKDEEKKDEVTEFYGYVDSDICSHLHISSINKSRVDCTMDTYKNGDNLVLLRLEDDLVLEAHKEKKLNPGDRPLGPSAEDPLPTRYRRSRRRSSRWVM